jgi:hypothetical protein
MQEFRHSDAKYRQDALNKYTNFIGQGTDYPLRDFVYKEDNRAEVIGYNKGLMFFHMLKVRFGKTKFLQALQKFYQENKFKTVSYAAIKDAFTSVTGSDLTTFFHQWVDLPGAPTLELTNVNYQQEELSFTLKQRGDHIYELLIPLEFIKQDGQTITKQVALNSNQQNFKFKISNLKELKVDPHFDLFRRVLPDEIASSLNQAWGSEQAINIIITSERYRSSAKELEKYFTHNQISYSKQLQPDRLNILLGGKEQFAQQLAPYNTPEYSIGKQITIKQRDYSTNSVVAILTAKNLPPLLFIQAEAGMEQRVVQKAIHYGKYSATVFNREQNILKTTWSVFNSPLFYHVEND